MNVTMTGTVQQRVVRVIAKELKIGEEEVAKDGFRIDSVADSLTKRDLIFALVEEFDREISDKEAAGFLEVNDVVNYVNAHLE